MMTTTVPCVELSGCQRLVDAAKLPQPVSERTEGGNHVAPVIWLAISMVLVLFLASFTAKIHTSGGMSAAIRSISFPGVMQVVVSILVMLVGLHVIRDQSYSAEDKKWGYGIVGTVVGYWLRSAGK